MAQELKRKGVTLTLLWQEYRTAHPDGYGYTWFCERFAAYQRRADPIFRHPHAAGAVMQIDYAGPTVEVIDPQSGEIRQAQIFVAVPRLVRIATIPGLSLPRTIEMDQMHGLISRSPVAVARIHCEALHG